jgi:GT2 family glycosyltransferase
MEIPSVDVVIVNWNGGGRIMRCLDAIHGQRGVRPTVTCVDNASQDGSLEAVRGRFPSVTTIALEHNVGFAAAVNRGLKVARSPWVLLINFDVAPLPDYCAALVRALEAEQTAGWAQGLLLRGTREAPSGEIDSAGHEILRNHWVRNRGEETPAGGTWPAEEVWGATAAAALYRRAMLDDVAPDGDVFDPAYFAYLEDVDLDWRAHWRGWRCLFVPTAVAYHERSGSGAWSRTALQRRMLANRYRTLVRNADLATYLRYLPATALFEVAKFAQLLLTHPSALLGYVDAARSLPATLEARRRLRARRQVSATQLRVWFRPVPYRQWMRRARLLGKRQTWISRSSS